MADCIKIRKRHVQILSNLKKAVNSARADSNGCAAVLLISFYVAVNLIRINADAFHAGTVHQFPVWFYFPLSHI